MMKKFILLCFWQIFATSFSQQPKNIDSTAVFLLDNMTQLIGDLQSVTFEIKNAIDKFNLDNHIEKHHSSSIITFSGPNKLYVRTTGTDINRGFWYDGSFLSYYNFDENNYVTLEAPETTIEMIDQMHFDYDFQFPAADFFYPSFTDDLIEQFDAITFLGLKTIEGEACYHIMATNKDLNLQLWISEENFFLPKQFVIIYKNKSNLQYQTTFKNWVLNPNIPDSVFDFLPPPKAKLISIMKKS